MKSLGEPVLRMQGSKRVCMKAVSCLRQWDEVPNRPAPHRGPRRAPTLRSLGWEGRISLAQHGAAGGMLSKVGKRPEPRRDGTVLTQTLSSSGGPAALHLAFGQSSRRANWQLTAGYWQLLAYYPCLRHGELVT